MGLSAGSCDRRAHPPCLQDEWDGTNPNPGKPMEMQRPKFSYTEYLLVSGRRATYTSRHVLSMAKVPGPLALTSPPDYQVASSCTRVKGHRFSAPIASEIPQFILTCLT